MTPERWQHVRAAFEHAVALDPSERSPFLDSICSDDVELRREVESLLLYQTRADGRFLETPAVDLLTPGPETGRLGRCVGVYRIVEEIGQGGMGEVYRAARIDGQFEKQVAVKLVRGGLSSSFVIERFRNERQILASLDHPNIARLLDGGTTDDGIPYLVMELIEGVPIDRYCDEHSFPVSRRLELFRQVCGAVQYAHQRLVIHRDIKPSNILVTREGIPKLLDFGVAKILDPSGSPETTVAPPMTPEYASPEQVRGEPITTATDVYSLGVVLYHLLTGHSPYPGETITPHELARAICQSEPDRPSTAVLRTGPERRDPPLTPAVVSRVREGSPARLRRRLAGDLDTIVLKALRKEPQWRYVSAEQLAEDLRRHLAGIPVAARKDSTWYRASKFARRHKVGVAATLLALLALVAGVGAVAREARIAQVNGLRAQRRFDDVRGLARSMMFELHDAIEPLPGSTAVRELLVRRALEYLDKLATEGGVEPALQRELAQAYLRIGDVQGNPGRDNLGQTVASLESYRKALAIVERLASILPGEPLVLDDLARAHGSVGLQLSRTGNSKKALDHLLTAIAIRQRLADQRPEDWSRQLALANSYQGLGDVLVTLEDWPRVLEMRQKALAPIRKAAEHMSGDATVRRSLAIAYKKLGAIQAKLKHYPEGLEAYQKALAIDEARLAADLNSVEARMDLSMSVSEIGYILWRSGDLRAALAHYARARTVREELTRLDPQNQRARLGLANTINRMAWIRRDLGEHDAALGDYHEALALFESLAVKNPGDLSLQVDFAQSLENLGTEYASLAARGRLGGCREARPLLSGALAVYRGLEARRALTGSNAGAPARVATALSHCGLAIR